MFSKYLPVFFVLSSEVQISIDPRTSMVQKRHFDSDETLEISYKQPKQVEPSDQLVSFSESGFPESQIPHTSEGGCRQSGNQCDEKLAHDHCAVRKRSAGDLVSGGSGSTSVSSWSTSSTSEEDAVSVPVVNVPLFPEYFSPDRIVRTLAHGEDPYSILLEHPPFKVVPIGPNHQAEIPECDSQGTKSDFDQLENCAISESNIVTGDEDNRRMMGTSVIPMPDLESSEYDMNKIENDRAYCKCEDEGSNRCVRQHIVEAREKLAKNIGIEKFVKLGLSDMGDQVAEKWSTADEQLFHEVVFSNPASLGKNFWVILANVFPSRTKMEIVSYYFNVFMLRRRAEQNRNDPMNIDSDNDEWQGSDDYGDDELGTQEEDEDSVVESPVYKGHHCGNFEEYDEQDINENCNSSLYTDFISRDIDDKKFDPRNLLHNGIFSPSMQDHNIGCGDEMCDQEVHDDSCTSSDTAVTSKVTKVNKEIDYDLSIRFNG